MGERWVSVEHVLRNSTVIKTVSLLQMIIKFRGFGSSMFLINSREKIKTLNYLESALKIDVCVCVREGEREIDC